MEAGLAVCLFVLPPLLGLAPRGATPLAAAAGLCAAGIVGLDLGVYGGRGLVPLRLPAAVLVLLVAWGGMSAAWSIDPWGSLVMDARLAGMFAAGLALAAAAGRVAAPRQMAFALFAGTALGLALAAADLASAGGLSRYVSVRPFAEPRLNPLAAWTTLLLLPMAAVLARRGRVLLALGVAAVMALAVYRFADTTAKWGLAGGLAVAALLYLRGVAVARFMAALCVLFVMTAPLTLPRLAHLPVVFGVIDAYKESAGHRLLIWSFAGDRIAERPLIGWGLNAARSIPGGQVQIRRGEQALPLHPHDAALQVWLELGLPGAALLAALIGWLWLRLGAAPGSQPLYAAAVAGSLAAALAAALSSWGFWEEWWLGMLAMAVFAILVLTRDAGALAPCAGVPTLPRRQRQKQRLRGSRGGGR